MTRAELLTLIAGGESSALELKKSTAEKERACRTLCAFANGEGGQAPSLVSSDGFVTVTFNRPDKEATNNRTEQVTPQVTPQVIALLQALTHDMSRHELMDALNLKERKHFSASYLKPALSVDLIEMTAPDKPNSSKQKYRLTAQGRAILSGLYTANKAFVKGTQ